MSIITVAAVVKAVQQQAAFGPIVVPDGTVSFRLEPDVDPTDWAAGMKVVLLGTLNYPNGKVEHIDCILFTSLDRTGNVAQPFRQFNCPLDLSDPANPKPIPYVGCTITGQVIPDRSTNIGVRFTAAPDPTQLPLPLPAPVVVQVGPVVTGGL